MSRTVNAVRNMKYGVAGRLANLVFAFASRTVFIKFLGNTYLGVNGLYSEILNLLSVADLGFGTAMTYAMYKPVADGDEECIIRLLNYYRRVYRIIALIITMLGVSLLPLLPSIVKGADWLTYDELRLYYLVFLANTVAGYLFTYKFCYLNALQKNYIETNTLTLIAILGHIAQIIAIVLTRNFLVYLLANSFVIIFSYCAVNYYLNCRFPILTQKEAGILLPQERQTINYEVKGLAVHQFASVAVHSTDNIIISSLSGMGVVAVGYISNYNMLITSVLAFVTIIFGSVTSGFGNIVASSTTENYRSAFHDMNFINFWVYGFCAISFWTLIPPFITLWIGSENLIDNISFLLIVINCYLQGQSTIYHNARIAKGNFQKDSKWAVIQAITNLVVSVVGAIYWGLVGVYIGTIVSRLVYIVFRPYSTYKYLFGKSPLEYYRRLAYYFMLVCIAGALTHVVTAYLLQTITVKSFLLTCIIDAIIPNAVFFLFSCRSSEFHSWLNRLKLSHKG